MRSQRFLVGLLGAALLGAAPVALTATAAQAGATYATSITGASVTPWRTTYLFGQAMTLSGTVARECVAGSGTYGCAPVAADDSVQVYRRMAGSTTWKPIGSPVAVSDSGTFTYRTTSVGTAAYGFIYSGSTAAGYQDTTWAGAALKGARHPHTRMATPGNSLYLRGNVAPGWGRKIVVIQRQTCRPGCPWRTYKKIRTTRTGAYSGRIAAPARGSDWYRVKVPADGPRFVAGFSTKVYRTYTQYNRPVFGR